jgi:hypothetical protein
LIGLLASTTTVHATTRNFGTIRAKHFGAASGPKVVVI